jgi:hypothetical protein
MSGDKILQTGGMIYTEANYKGQQLSLQQNLQVQFNSKESKLEGMQLFSGERNVQKNGDMNWRPLSNQSANEEVTTIFASSNGPFLPFLVLNEKTNNPLSLQELCDTTGCYPLLIKENKKGGFSVRPNMSNVCGAMAMFMNDRPTLPLNTPIEKIHKMTFAEAYELYKVDKFNDLKIQNSAKWDTLMNRKARFTLTAERRIKEQEQRRAMNDLFLLPKLGWFNCDKYQQNEMAQLKTISNLKVSSESFGHCKVIMKKRKAVVTDIPIFNQEYPVSIPINEEFFMVAIIIDKGESYFAISEGVSKQFSEVVLNYKQMSADEIKEKLKILDN